MNPSSSSVYSKESIQIETSYPASSRQFNYAYRIYHEIYEFIMRDIVLKSDLLSSCIMVDGNEEENPSIEFFINCIVDLTYVQGKKLTYEVLESVYDFCRVSGFQDKFNDISIFLIKH